MRRNAVHTVLLRGGPKRMRIHIVSHLHDIRTQAATKHWQSLASATVLQCEGHMNAPTSPSLAGPVVGLDAIGSLFGRSRDTIRRWIQHEDFPASRLPDGSWTTSHTLIDGWLMARAAKQQGN